MLGKWCKQGVCSRLQAQFVAALRAALKPGAAPALAVCGGALATTFLSAGLAAGDGAVMKRLMDLLVAPLQVCRNMILTRFHTCNVNTGHCYC